MFILAKWIPRIACLALAWCLWCDVPQAAETSSSARQPGAVAADIDRAIDLLLTEKKIPGSPAADDAEFLRRACLDITGRIPTAARTLAFLDSTDPDKRRLLIDELLASSDYGRHLATAWANLVVANGDPDAKVQTKAFAEWLAKAFNQGKGWDKIVQEMLTVQGKPADNPAALFTLANSSQPGMLGSATTKLFLGIQIQCAECHNHPFNDKWHQTDYWGMAAFFGRLKGGAGKNKNGNGAEIVETAVPAKAAGGKKNNGPTAGTPGTITIPATGGNKGAGKVVAAKFLEGSQPTLPVDGAIRPHLADWLTAADNRFFAQATVNRLWGQFFGAGFVNPVDDFENGNDPSHPELLALLAKEFVASGHDYKHLIRCICNSRAYQRTSRTLPENKDDEALFSHVAVKLMSAEVMYDSLTTAMGVKDLPGGLGSQPRYGDGKGKNAKGGATARVDARAEFIRFFNTKDDNASDTEYTHGIPQILGLMNNPQFNRSTPLIDKLAKPDVSRDKAIEELYLATLSRRPSAGEVKLMTAYLDKAVDLKEGYGDLLWILFNTSEFVLNH